MTAAAETIVPYFAPGFSGETVGKTITETDIRYYQKLACSSGLYEDGDLTAVPELLITMVAIGLMNRLGFLEKNLIAVMENEWQYRKKANSGETVKVLFDVEDVLPTKKGDRQAITYLLRVVSQENGLIANGKWRIMVKV